MSTTKKNNVPPEKLELYEKLVATIPDIERKGASVPYTSLNGNMFSYLHASGAMALRLPKGEREEFWRSIRPSFSRHIGSFKRST